MKFFVISGAPNTGKTTAINNVAEWLTSGVITTDIYGKLLPIFLPNTKGKYSDFSIVIISHGKKIIIPSATDDRPWMNKLIEKIKQNPDAEIVITSCRDIDLEREYFLTNLRPYASFLLESPLGKITRKNKERLVAAQKWYKNTLILMHQHILSNNPYNL
ncbi:hypothetical protein [Flavobacterium frigidarium]|uniref:G domain-containing protein n=1 Tax=Flavobacterium frigidarium TaxID=99286 RepID=A0ABV4KGU2_9FLAO